MIKMDLRVVTLDVPRQEMMTRDSVPATVDAVVYFRVVDPEDARSSRSRPTPRPPSSSPRRHYGPSSDSTSSTNS